MGLREIITCGASHNSNRLGNPALGMGGLGPALEMLKVLNAKSTEDNSSRAACSAINLQNVSLLRVSFQCRVFTNLSGWT